MDSKDKNLYSLSFPLAISEKAYHLSVEATSKAGVKATAKKLADLPLFVEGDETARMIEDEYKAAFELVVTDHKPAIDFDAEFKRIIPNLKRREEIEDEIAALKASDMQGQFTEEFNQVQQEYFEQKKKLDQALRGGIITQYEYEEKIAGYKSRVENFEEIQRIKAQYDMEIISKDEMKRKLRALGAEV